MSRKITVETCPTGGYYACGNGRAEFRFTDRDDGLWRIQHAVAAGMFSAEEEPTLRAEIEKLGREEPVQKGSRPVAVDEPDDDDDHAGFGELCDSDW